MLHRPATTSATSRTEFATPSEYFRAPVMPRGVGLALWPTLDKSRKPYAFASLERLARHIHRARAGFGIELSEEPVSFADGRRTLIRIDAHDASGERHRLIGYAWLGRDTARPPAGRMGAGRDALTAAILAHQPAAPAADAA